MFGSFTETKLVKTTIVGDGAVGKTSMLLAYSQKRFPTDYVPTVFENHNVSVQYGDEYVSLALWDTAGQEEFERLRPLSYPETNVFLIAFSLVDPDSLANVLLKWHPEIRKYAPNIPILLVGMKLDLREDPQVARSLQAEGLKPVTRPLAKRAAREIRASGYFECSAKTQRGLKEVFDRVLEIALSIEGEQHNRRRSRNPKVNCGACLPRRSQ